MTDQLTNIKEKYESACDLLKDVPGFVGLGIGYLKTAAGEEPALSWRLYLDSPEFKHITGKLYGYPIEVIEQEPTTLCYGQEHEDELRPGLKISSKADPADGSLGCFVQLVADTSRTFILSNSHVLLGDINSNRPVSAGVGSKVGQPTTHSCCCCRGRIIGEVATGGDQAFDIVEVSVPNSDGGTDIEVGSETDCALAEWDGTRNFTNESEFYGMITGTPASGLGVEAGDTVEKVGATTGYTKGIILPISEDIQGTYVSGGTGPVGELVFPAAIDGGEGDTMGGAVPNINLFIVQPIPVDECNMPDGGLRFVAKGDSGSVVVNSSRQVIGQVIREWPIEDENDRDILSALTGTDIPENVRACGLVGQIQPILDLLQIQIPDNFHGTATASAPVLEVPGSALLHQRENERFAAIERLQKELADNEHSKFFIDSILRFRDEVMDLVNHKRQVMLVWHRNQGPAFLTHLAESLEDKRYTLPAEIKGITILHLMEQMKAILSIYGSDALIAEISRLSIDIHELFGELNSIWDLADRLKQPHTQTS